jgi:hypothetical protein
MEREVEKHLVNSPEFAIKIEQDKDAKWTELTRKNLPTDFEILGKPKKVEGIWCGECSSIPAEIFNYKDVYIFRSSNGIRVKCVQCLAEWYGRHGIGIKRLDPQVITQPC